MLPPVGVSLGRFFDEWLYLPLEPAFADFGIQEIDDVPEENSGQSPGDDVGNEMDSQVNPAIGRNHSPKENRPPEDLLAKEQRHKHRKAKSIGRVAGDEAIHTTPITKGRLYHILKVRVVRRAETMEVILAEAGSELVAKGYHQGNRQENQKAFPPILLID